MEATSRPLVHYFLVLLEHVLCRKTWNTSGSVSIQSALAARVQHTRLPPWSTLLHASCARKCSAIVRTFL
jgi:hypothetical protein